METGCNGNKSILYGTEKEYLFLNTPPIEVVIIQSIDTKRLIYFLLLSKEQKEKILNEHTTQKNKRFSLKGHYDILELDNGQVMLSLLNDEGELYNSLDEYIEIRLWEGNKWGSVVLPKK